MRIYVHINVHKFKILHTVLEFLGHATPIFV